jgi:hypothetical protein
LLERPEQPLGISNSAARIPERDCDPFFLRSGAYRHHPPCLIRHGSFAVLDEVQKNLHQTLPIGPNSRKPRLHAPVHLDPAFPQRRFHDDPQFF